AVPDRAAAVLGGPGVAGGDPRAAAPARPGAADSRRDAARRARGGSPRRAAGGIERQVLLFRLRRAARRPPALRAAGRGSLEPHGGPAGRNGGAARPRGASGWRLVVV